MAVFAICIYAQVCPTPRDSTDYIAHQAPLATEFSRQEYWNGLPSPFPGDLPDPGVEPMSLASLALAGGFFITSATWEAQVNSLPTETPRVFLFRVGFSLLLAFY